MAIGAFCSLALFSFLFGKGLIIEGRTLILGQCELNGVSFLELRKNFDAIRESVQTQDKRTDIVILKKNVLQEVTLPESCCLLRHLLRFYIERIFNHYKTKNNLLRRKASRLANTFLSIKANLRQCEQNNKCPCGEDSHRLFQLVLEEYEKLDMDVAEIKVMGEMSILFAWMKSFSS